MRERAVYRYLALVAQDGVHWRHALWAVPGSSPIVTMLQFCAGGMWPVRWFSQVDPASPSCRRRTAGADGGSASPPCSRPGDCRDRHTWRPTTPCRSSEWMREVHEAGGVPHIQTFPSSAVRLCQAAAAAGLVIAGVVSPCSGSRSRPLRLDLIRRTGAVVRPSYSTVECGPIASGCGAPAAADDTHLYHDRHALVQPGTAWTSPGLPSDGLLVTTIQPGGAADPAERLAR